MKLTDYVNVFQGSGEINLPEPEGIAAKWFFIKAGCGNTSPAAVLPFGAMSIAPFTGGYPTGYGDHLPNSHSRPAHFEDGKKIIGFSHLHQSGTGAIGYYYNYAVTTPRYKSSDFRRVFSDEYAYPGYYKCRIEDIDCELTVSERIAYHRYSFGKEGGLTEIDFSNNGLSYDNCDKAKVHNLIIQSTDNIVTAKAEIEGINLYFAVASECSFELMDNKAVFFADKNNKCEFRVAVSLSSIDTAVSLLDCETDFDIIRAAAEEKWSEQLGRIIIDNCDIAEIFYSNYYHSCIKPSDWHGESFVYEKGKAFTTDFATLWDMYKTALPLIFLTNKEMSEKIAETLLSLGEALDSLPNSFGLTDRYSEFSDQARVLAIYVLLTAYRYNIISDSGRLLNVLKKDIFSEEKKDFRESGKCVSHTFTLDIADACALTAELAAENNDYELCSLLKPLAAHWQKVYSEATGLLLNDCTYYEGTNYNYSFRQMVSMKKRIEIAGGKEKFVRLLDDFFGYGHEDIIQPTDPFNYKPVEEGMKLGRFEGFNNESDTEAPFSYIYADRHDRTCEILRSGLKYMFTAGRGGLPGNNDSGALSSYYVFAALGLYPIAGQDLFLLSSPLINKAEIQLSSGNKLIIEVYNNSDKNIYAESIFFNNEPVFNYSISAKRLLEGGKLVFNMSDKPTGNN